jgi:hypothetical protein
MKLHYGFLFFDYLFKFILQLTKKENKQIDGTDAPAALTAHRQ